MSERKDYIDKMAQQLKAWDDEIVKFQEKASQVNENVRQKYKDEISRLKERRQQLQFHMDELKRSSDIVWTELKSGLEKSWSDIRTAYDNIRVRLKDQGE